MTTGRSVAVLAYHKVGPPSPGSWETWYHVPAVRLRDQLGRLVGEGWEFIDLDGLIDGLADPSGLPERGVLVTFDDGYRSVLSHGLDVLAAVGAPAVIFVPTDYVGGRADFDAGTSQPVEPLCSWSDLADLARAGVSVQSHAVSHRAFSEMSAAEVEEELLESKRVIEDRLGGPVRALAYPYGDGGRATTVEPLLAEAGFDVAFGYGGGPVGPPVGNRFRVVRIPVGPETDLQGELDHAD